MIVSAWNNGQHYPTGAGYGIKISIEDRDTCFSKGWDCVVLELEDWDADVEVNVKKQSFWGATCRELISADIGRWLQASGLAPWPKGKPPKLLLEPLSGNRFSLIQP
jgi:hypothetical protein